MYDYVYCTCIDNVHEVLEVVVSYVVHLVEACWVDRRRLDED